MVEEQEHEPNIVVDLMDKAWLASESEVYVDNLLTYFKLLAEMSARGICGTGT